MKRKFPVILLRFLNYYSFLGGMRGGVKVVVTPHRLEGIFMTKGQQDALLTKSLVPGDSVYNEKKIAVQVNTDFNYFE